MINIIGPGRVGHFFHQTTPSRLYGRRQSLQNLSPHHPTLICTRITDLKDVLTQLPAHTKSQLIFVQNGLYEPLLKDFAITQHTQLLLYIAIPHKHAGPIDGKQSIITGPHSDLLQAIFKKHNLSLRTVTPEEFRCKSFEKSIWLSVFGLLCDLYQLSVGAVITHHLPTVLELTSELQHIATTHASVPCDPRLSERILQYSRTLGDHYTASLKEFPYRNGWFWNTKPTPLHGKLLHLWRKQSQDQNQRGNGPNTTQDETETQEEEPQRT